MRDQQTSSDHTSQLSEDLLRIGAEETTSGLVIGIVLSMIFALAGIVLAFAGVAQIIDPQPGVDEQSILPMTGAGVFIFAFGAFITARQIRVRDKIKSALEKQD